MHVRVPVCVCAHVPVWPVQAPHLLVVDIGKDTSNNLQQEDDEEQDEVLGQGKEAVSRDTDTPVPWGFLVSRPNRVPTLSSQVATE